MEKKFEIDIKRLLFELLYRAWIIILAAMITALGAYVYAKTQLVPRYTASASLYVSNYEDSSGQQTVNKVNSSDIYTSQTLVQTYLTFLSTDKVLDEVSKKFGNIYTNTELRSMITAGAMNETEIFNISVTCEDAKRATDIVNTIADLAPETIQQYVEGSSVKIVDYAKVPTMRSFPVYRTYLKIGFFIGGALASIIIIIMFLFNSKISTEDDIIKIFNAPVIGKIPNFNRLHQGHGYNRGYRYKYSYEAKPKKEGKQ